MFVDFYVVYHNAKMYSIISISIYYKLILTSLAIWVLEISYIYGRNKALKIRFFFHTYQSIFFQLTFLSSKIYAHAAENRFLLSLPRCINTFTV
jgi:hypothetical protein